MDRVATPQKDGIADVREALRRHEERVGEMLEAHQFELTVANARQQVAAAAGERASWAETMMAEAMMEEVVNLRDFLGEELQKNAAAVQRLQGSVDVLLQSGAASQQPRVGRVQQPLEGPSCAAEEWRQAGDELRSPPREEKHGVGAPSPGRRGVGAPSLGEPAPRRSDRAPSSDPQPGDHPRTPLVPKESVGPPRRRSSTRQSSKYMPLDETHSFADLANENLPQMGDQFTKLFEKLDDIWNAEEPLRTGAMADAVASTTFKAFIAVVIVANSCFMFYSNNHRLELVIRNGDAEDSWFFAVDFCFWLVYSVELLCKLAVHRWFFFWNAEMVWNLLDLFLVVRGLIDVISFLTPLDGEASTIWLRLLRVLRVVRVLRVLRVLRFFSEAYTLMNAIIGSAMHLFWSVMVIAILIFMFSLYLTSSVEVYLEDADSVESKEPQAMITYFGSVQVCMLSLYMSLTGGSDWSELYSTLVPAGLGYAFLFFVAWSQVCLLNIVTGIFVEQAMKLAMPDFHERARQQSAEDHYHMMTVQRLLHLADQDEDGLIQREDFDAVVKDGDLAQYLVSLGIEASWSNSNLPFLYEVVAEECRAQYGGDPASDGVEIPALVGRIMAMRGVARSTDIMDLRDRVCHMQSVQELMLENTGLSVDERGIVDASGNRRLRRRRLRRDMT